MEFLKDFFILLGRILIAGSFFWIVYEKIKHWDVTMAYMKSKHVPQAKIVLPISVGLKTLGALLVLFGWYAHLGALILLVLTIASLAKLHQFWKLQGPERQIELMLFIKDTAIAGALFILLAIGAGKLGA